MYFIVYIIPKIEIVAKIAQRVICVVSPVFGELEILLFSSGKVDISFLSAVSGTFSVVISMFISLEIFVNVRTSSCNGNSCSTLFTFIDVIL